MAQDIGKVYSDLAPSYNERLTLCHYITPHFVASVLKELAFPPGTTVLDLGAGTGLVGVHAEQLGLEVDFVAFDMSPDMLAQIPSPSLYTERREGNIHEALPFAEEAFDAVVSAGLWEYVERPGNFLAEMDRVLKKGGFVVFSYPPSSGPERETFDVGHEVYSHPQLYILEWLIERDYLILSHTHFDAYANNDHAVVHHLLAAQKSL